MFTDSHAHIDSMFFKDELAGVIARFRAAGVDRVLTVGSSADLAHIEAAVATAHDNADVFAAVGVHPHDGDRLTDAILDRLVVLAADPKVKAIGETGLDFHYEFSSRAGQVDAFARQLDLATQLGMPVVIHCREAHPECIDLVRSRCLPDRPGQLHCFTGTLAEVRQWLDLGFMISIPGVVTFKNIDALAEAVRYVPDDALLIETDSPYLAPAPMRGRVNEPAFIVHTAAAVARIRGVSVEHIALVTTANADRLFCFDN